MTTRTETARNELAEAIGRIAKGDRKALEFVYRATSAKLFGICLRISGDRGEAEDALQDVYVNLWNAAGRFDAARASPVSWLAVFARNRTIDRLRRRRVDASAPLEAANNVADAAPLAEDALLAGEENARIHTCLETLEERQRGVIRTAFFDGVTYADLAARQNVPHGTVKSWVRRGLARLKQCLEA